MWQPFMDRVLVETNVKHRFTEHDLRAKVASDAASLEKVRALLQDADARTARVPAKARTRLSAAKEAKPRRV